MDGNKQKEWQRKRSRSQSPPRHDPHPPAFHKDGPQTRTSHSSKQFKGSNVDDFPWIPWQVNSAPVRIDLKEAPISWMLLSYDVCLTDTFDDK